MNWFRLAPLLAVFSTLPALAQASEPRDPLIYKGTPVATCGWPTAVAVAGGGLCTGTLIHPQLVIYAAHCGAGQKSLRFGESSDNPGQTITGTCATNPGYTGAGDQGHDWAYCVLSQPVTQLPITPPLVGCDLDVTSLGDEVAIVGFGASENSGAGTKRWAYTILGNLDLEENIALVGSNDLPSVCPGDSGGPIFVKVVDGSWRALGIASTVQGGCGGLGTHSLIPGALEWVESNAGIDVTPCTDTQGNWTPTAECEGFFAGSEVGVGSWQNWCAGTPASGVSKTCGPGHGEPADDEPPAVTIVVPDTDQVFEMAPGIIDPIVVDANDGDGWGVVFVELKINGEFPGISLDAAPWEFEGVQFPIGTYELVAVAEDWYGNVGESEPRMIYVETDPGDGDGDGDGEGEGEGDGDGSGEGDADGDTGGESGDGSAETDDAAAGCGCTSGARIPSSALVLVALAGLGVRRRRNDGWSQTR